MTYSYGRWTFIFVYSQLLASQIHTFPPTVMPLELCYISVCILSMDIIVIVRVLFITEPCSYPWLHFLYFATFCVNIAILALIFCLLHFLCYYHSQILWERCIWICFIKSWISVHFFIKLCVIYLGCGTYVSPIMWSAQ